ncbi:MAG: VWA domain-containing protein [Acidobacteria bacterium]|nr:VWA domain-containing protein [Acidobacteriota bacterium]
MSFGAMAGWQAWGLLALTAAVLTGLFYMKIRAPRVHVPSLMLWQQVLDATREMTLWERIRKTVSWIVIAATGVMLMLALTRPAPSVTAVSGGRRLIVIDSSWSMGARMSDGGTRWDRAIAHARTLIAASAGDEVALATTADGLVEGPTADAVLLEAALDRLAPSGGEGGDWPRLADVAVVHFMTDGVIPRATADLEASGARVSVEPVFEAAANVAITAFETHAAGDPEAQDEAYLELANYSGTAQPVQLVVTRGTTTVADVSIDLAAGEAVRQIVPLGRTGDARVRARITARDNALAIDDEAVAWIAGADALAVTVVSEAPGFLQLLFDRLPGLSVTFIPPAAYSQPRNGPEHVIVFDHWVPADAPSTPSLFVAPPPGSAVDVSSNWIGSARTENSPTWATSVVHPVLAGVDPSTVTLERARSVESDAWTPIARSATGTPLVSVGETEEFRRVVFGFGFTEAESNVALQPAFPVLVVNALEWLGRPALGSQVRPGVVSLDAVISRLTSPQGERVEVMTFGETRLARITSPGLYLAEGGGMRSALAVNVGDPQVSNVGRTSLTEATLSTSAEAQANAPWWPTLIAIAFVFVLVEWWTWHRRITV